jgi:exodeoxyribonuclease VII small subunit
VDSTVKQQAPLTGEVAQGFDSVLQRLRNVVERLEAGNLTLEQSLQVFEEGVSLSRRGAQILDCADKRVDLLLQAEEGVKSEPFVARGEAGSERPEGTVRRDE